MSKVEKAEGRGTFLDNLTGLTGRVREIVQPKEKDGEPNFVDRAVETGVKKGIASFEKKARAKLPDAGILAGAGLIILLLLGALFYWARK